MLIAMGFLAVFAASAAQEDVLKNDTIIEMKQLGLGETVILEKIKNSRCEFDVSLNGLKQLKTAGISDGVITAMVSAKPIVQGGGDTIVQKPAAPDDPNDPTSLHEAGIWMYEEAAGKKQMTQLEPSVYSQKKTGAGLFIQFGETVKNKAVVASAHAGIVTTNRQPTFYFYFEHTKAGLSDTHHGATSANEYILTQFDVDEKDNQRKLVMGSLNAYSGGESGAEGRSVRSFGFKKLAPGIYQVSPKEPLANGEYGFYYGGNTGSGKVFDFGVKGSPETEPPPLFVEGKKQKSNKNDTKPVFQNKGDAPVK